MGCDIHAFIEVHELGRWHTRAELFLDRSYRAFFALGGVRGDRGSRQGKTWDRGVPGDAGGQTLAALDDFDADAHGHSWATLDEVRAIAPGDWFDDHDYFAEIADTMEVLGRGKPVRLVFFFDN